MTGPRRALQAKAVMTGSRRAQQAKALMTGSRRAQQAKAGMTGSRRAEEAYPRHVLELPAGVRALRVFRGAGRPSLAFALMSIFHHARGACPARVPGPH